MALTDNKIQRLLLFTSVYGLQGLIRGFVTIALAGHLIEEGVSDSQVGLLVGLNILPWTFKVVWAPWVDGYRSNPQRSRLHLITFSQLGVILGLLMLLGIKNPSESLWLAGCNLFLIGLFISIQDVVSDALAIETVPSQELGIINSGMQFGRMGGTAVGASASAICLVQVGFAATVSGLALLSALLLLIPLFLADRTSDHVVENGNAKSSQADEPKHVSSWHQHHWQGMSQLVRSVFQSLSSQPAFTLLLFGFVASAGDGILTFIDKPFYIKQLGWTATEHSLFRSYGHVGQALGAILAGILISQLRNTKWVSLVSFLMAALMAFIVGIIGPHYKVVPVAYLMLAPAVSTIGWVGFLALSMKTSRSRFAATLFTIIVSLCNLGSFFGITFASPVLKSLGLEYSSAFIGGGVITVVACTALAWHDCSRVRSTETTKANEVLLNK